MSAFLDKVKNIKIDVTRFKSTYGIVMVVSFLVLIIALGWLLILSKRLQKSYNQNSDNMANQVMTATILCLLALIGLAVSGVLMVGSEQ